MNILITGATGFLGRRLTSALLRDGHEIGVLTRHPKTVGEKIHLPVRAWAWQPEREEAPAKAFEGMDAVIHLAGEAVAARRWSPEQKRRMYDSRVLGTRNLLAGLRRAPGPHPRTVITASAIGYYGYRGDALLTESSSPGNGFLAEICRDWEKEAATGVEEGTRLALLRIGIVLGQEGGALKKLLPLFKAGLGGPVADGRQWMSWIHVDDLISLFLFALDQTELTGPINGVAPNPVTNETFSRALGKCLHRPALLRAPAFALKLALGEMAELVLGSQRIIPERATAAGFRFRFPEVATALDDLVKKKVLADVLSTVSSGSPIR